ncbi:MAG TPA: sugar transferase [Blastocatellia bacterium]|nr:sugar transferase [Blastocatellia bacterium]
MILVAIAVKLDSAGPIFYTQERVGKNGRRFKIFKFRSMRTDAEELSGPVWAEESDPRVTVALLEVNSAKIGVLGEVRTHGVIIMNHPICVLDAITAAGGITDLGNASSVSILRQYEDGRVEMVTSNVKKILKGKADPEENAYLRAGDTIIVHGNLYKKI